MLTEEERREIAAEVAAAEKPRGAASDALKVVLEAEPVKVSLDRQGSGRTIGINAADREDVDVATTVLMRGKDGEVLEYSSSSWYNEISVPHLERCRFTVTNPDYAPAVVEVEAGEEDRELKVTLSAGGNLILRVLDSEGAAVEGAEADVVDGSGWSAANDLVPDPGGFGVYPYRWLSGTDGSVAIEHLSPGSYRVSARRGGKRSNEVTVTIAEGKPVEARVTMPE